MEMEEERSALGAKLIEKGILKEDQVSRVIEEAAGKGMPLSRYLAGSGLVPKAKVYETLAELYGVPYVDISNFQVSAEAIQCLPSELARRYRAIPLFQLENKLNIAMENPGDTAGIDLIAQKSQCSVEVCLAAPEDIETALRAHYGSGSAIHELLKTLSKERSHHRPKSLSPKAAPPASLKGIVPAGRQETRPVIQLVDLIIKQAFEEGASDIHIEPEEKTLRVRYRVDGVLHEASTPPKELESEIISRIKVLAEMDIAETRIPQDSRIKMKIEGKDIDMRVSTMPTIYGENVVIRILKESQEIIDLASLGLSAGMGATLEELIHRPWGMILETGPTGSGKTTTLYAALQVINTVERNIVTIEDPIEYKLPLIRQIPVNVKAGLTFANALRSILRQDPDVIMVGEIRDEETAQIAIQSALTGHLVFTTVHANSAAGVVTRLVEMKVEPFLVASSVIGVISQRLVRRICQRCKEPYQPSEMELAALKWSKPAAEFRAFKGVGCRHCRQTGYKGRVGIFEILKMNDEIQKKIMASSSAAQIELAARQTGNPGLREDALEKIMAGLTTIDEVVKTIGAS